MADVPLAFSTTLASFKALVRSQTGTLSQQESGLLDPMLNPIVNQAVLFVRTVARKLLDPKYSTTVSVDEENNLISVATDMGKDIADINKLILWDDAIGQVPLVSDSEFYSLKTIYSATDLANAVFAHVTQYDPLGLAAKLVVEVYRGTNKTGSIIGRLTFPRNPVLPTSETDKIDLPEEYITIAVDVATVMVFRRLAKQAPMELEARVLQFVNSQMASLGLTVTPSKS